LQVILEDTGPTFNPAENLERANSILDKSLEERPLGGLGIYLALEGVDHFAYERLGDYNRSLLTVNRQDHR
jgi:anti-sigma regulatory factor (Ser/Thr protein kinase)